VIRLRSARADQVPAMIRLIGQSVCCVDAAEPMAGRLESFLRVNASISPDPSAPKVFLELYGPYKTAGSDTYADDLLHLAGGQNIASASSGHLLFSPEQLVGENPDAILFVDEFADAAGIVGRAGLSGLSAVQSGRLLPINRYWLVAGPGLPDAVRQLRRLLDDPNQPQRGN